MSDTYCMVAFWWKNQLIQNISSFFQTVAMVTKITNLEQKSHDSMVKTIVLAHFQATVYSYIFDTQKQSLCTINIWCIKQTLKLKLMLFQILNKKSAHAKHYRFLSNRCHGNQDNIFWAKITWLYGRKLPFQHIFKPKFTHIYSLPKGIVYTL